ncbi:hypothetical protein [Micromonospora sp. NPDC000668]|uniref:hypothetical protein n=1 Tax=Micromonospora sp. NPDC000668 TaxID=3364219 RepID=UPI0036737EE8
MAPFGVGAMSVLVNGTSVITAGLDHWYDVDDGSNLALEEYQEHDWRLEVRLRVPEFRLPPDWRPGGMGNDTRNVRLAVPVLRFPRFPDCHGNTEVCTGGREPLALLALAAPPLAVDDPVRLLGVEDALARAPVGPTSVR